MTNLEVIPLLWVESQKLNLPGYFTLLGLTGVSNVYYIAGNSEEEKVRYSYPGDCKIRTTSHIDIAKRRCNKHWKKFVLNNIMREVDDN